MKVEETKLFSLYLHELFWLALGIRKHCEAIFNETHPPEQGRYIKVSPELHTRIVTVLINAANIKKLIQTSKNKFKNESKTAYQFRKQRSSILSNALKGVQLNELLNNKVRNSLEHFDEYLDRANIQLSEKGDMPSPMAAYNMTLSNRDVFSPHAYPIRVYIASERKFYNLKYSIDLGKIYEETLAILECLRNSGRLPNEPGGLMFPLN